MKIIINATNIIEDRPLREVERLINLGKAHLPKFSNEELKNELEKRTGYKVEVKDIYEEKKEDLPAQSGVIFSTDLIPLHNDGDVILNNKQQEALKEFTEKMLSEITFEDLDNITEVDLIEPIPIDKYVDFESPKKMSLLKKLRNKII